MIEDDLRNAMSARAAGVRPNRERLYKAQIEASRRRRRRDTVTAAVTSSAFTFLALVGVASLQGGFGTQPDDGATTVNLAAQLEAETQLPPEAVPDERPGTVIGAAASGRLVLIDGETGKTSRLLATVTRPGDPGRGALLGGVAYDTRASRILFDVASADECNGLIRSIAPSGGPVADVTDGMLPTVSADGRSLLLARNRRCAGPEIVVRDLASGTERVVVRDDRAERIASLSWSPDGTTIAADVRYADYRDNAIVLIPAAGLASLGDGRRLTPPRDAREGTTWQHAAFTRDGRLFAAERCCPDSDDVSNDILSRMIVINADSGALATVVALGVTTKTHTGTAADESGNHLLYLSGQDLMVSDHGERPAPLAYGLVGAAWLD